jgi:hypothetical protein
MWQAFWVGWFGCLMSAFPVAMLLIIPDIGWDRKALTTKVENLERHNKDYKNIIDALLKERMYGKQTSTDQEDSKEASDLTVRGVSRKQKVDGRRANSK